MISLIWICTDGYRKCGPTQRTKHKLVSSHPYVTAGRPFMSDAHHHDRITTGCIWAETTLKPSSFNVNREQGNTSAGGDPDRTRGRSEDGSAGVGRPEVGRRWPPMQGLGAEPYDLIPRLQPRGPILQQAFVPSKQSKPPMVYPLQLHSLNSSRTISDANLEATYADFFSTLLESGWEDW